MKNPLFFGTIKRVLGVIVQILLLANVLLLPSACASHGVNTDRDYHIASWYGDEFHGKPTSSGEPFDMYAYTCAHREYAFGSILRVTHVPSGKSVTCLVNDRGPFVRGRDIDLSYASAREIGLLQPGVSPVKIEYIGRNDSFVRRVNYAVHVGALTIQVGSFRVMANADRLKESLKLKYDGIYVVEAEINGNTYYRVRIGRMLDREEAETLAQSLVTDGYQALIINYDDKI